MPNQNPHPVYHKTVAGKRKKLGELLIRAGLIDTEKLAEALDLQKLQNKKLGQVLIDMEAIDHAALGQALATQLHIPFVRLENKSFPEDALSKVPPEIAEKYSIIPIKMTRGKLVVAVANPLELAIIDDLQFVTQMPIYLVVSPLGDILDAIAKFYPKPDIETYLDPGIDVPADMEIIQAANDEDGEDQDLLNLVDLPPVVRLTNMVLAEGLRLRASDIHIEPHQKHLVIRCRVDGVMHETMRTESHVHASLVSRIKVISGLDISIRRKAQDGKAQVNFGGEKYDLRVSTIPTSYGEKVTIRVLDPRTARLAPEDLGFSDQNLSRVLATISLPQGIMLVTGPTGSGKSSTLYACLNQLNTQTVNIITVEDPVEFDVEGINQVQINPKSGITFAAGLRSILRQDPDIVMVGEIRDEETAAVAFQAAQTGHLVLSTLHTNDAPSAVTRLLDLKIDDFQLSAALLAVIGQRLVRRIHQACRVPDELHPQVLHRVHTALGHTEAGAFWKGAGCEQCLGSGYSGRMGLFEVLTITPSLKRIITSNVPAHDIQRAAENEGFQTLAKDGIRKALKGLTSIEEVFRVAPVAAPDSQPEGTLPSVADTAGRVSPDDAKAGIAPSADARRTPPPSTRAARPKRRAGGTGKILVVDDSEELRALLRHILESKQYTVLSAENGRKALQLAEAEEPGLMITDYKMPEMDGMALIQAMKSKDATSRIPIIMLTSKDEVESEIKVLDAGADDYLTKPFDKNRLLARVRRFFIQRKKILIVDDSPDVLHLLQHILRSNNFLTVTAENGKQAQSVLREEKPDLIITDYSMPEMDGIALIREIRSHENTHHIPIIMLTAIDEVESEIEVIDAGADDYMTKPVNDKRLVSRIKRLLAKG
jgi:type IV pilus assembly protein PilB